MKLPTIARAVEVASIVCAIVGAIVLMTCLTGCASTSDTRSSKHIVIERQEHVVIPTTGEIVAVTNTEESWEDAKAHTEATTTPDVKQIAPVVATIANAAAPGLGVYVEAGLTLLAGTMTAWGAAKHGEAKRLKVDSDEGWKLANENALKVTPT